MYSILFFNNTRVVETKTQIRTSNIDDVEFIDNIDGYRNKITAFFAIEFLMYIPYSK